MVVLGIIAAVLLGVITAVYMERQCRNLQTPNMRPRWVITGSPTYYDAVVGTTTRERSFKQALIQQARVEPNHQVLDLAAGTGTLAIWMKQQLPQANVTASTVIPPFCPLPLTRQKKPVSRCGSTAPCPTTCRTQMHALIAWF